MVEEPKVGFELLKAALNRLNIPYLVGGSLASSIHGIVRATRDIDLVVDLKLAQVPLLAKELERDFYADVAMMEEGVRRGELFNTIHYASSFKFDLIPLKSDAFAQTQFARREKVASDLFGGEPIEFVVATAEDTILVKLVWFRMGGETSDQQWNDMKGILKVQGDRLDTTYMHQWATHLKVEDLLDKLFSGE